MKYLFEYLIIIPVKFIKMLISKYYKLEGDKLQIENLMNDYNELDIQLKTERKYNNDLYNHLEIIFDSLEQNNNYELLSKAKYDILNLNIKYLRDKLENEKIINTNLYIHLEKLIFTSKIEKDINIKLKQQLEEEIYNNNCFKTQLKQLEKIRIINNELTNKLENQNNIIIDLMVALKTEKIINIELNDKMIKQIQYNTELKDTSNKCSICLENDLSICCIPCGHTYCNNCIMNSYHCFICRKVIIHTQKIYI